MGLNNYVQETRAEMKHVTWPSKGQAIGYTILVIVISIALSFFLGFFDLIFTKLLRLFA